MRSIFNVYLMWQKSSKLRKKEDAMFRVEKTDYVNKTFRLPLELVQKLERLAQAQQVSMNQLVLQCCNYALEHLDEKQRL